MYERPRKSAIAGKGGLDGFSSRLFDGRVTGHQSFCAKKRKGFASLANVSGQISAALL